MLEQLNKNEKGKMIKGFPLDKVKITDPYSVNAMERELEYLLDFNPDKLIAGFYEMQGLKGKDEKYPGWEDTEIKGHTLGHYLVALSQAYLNTKSKKILERIDYMSKELKTCQLSNGYLFASEEEIFDRVENRQPAWVPWYTMHKVFTGLVAVYQATNNTDAFEVVSKLGDWVYDRTSKWSKELQDLVLSVEYGGMNDVLYDLYKITEDKKHLEAAHKFDEIYLFEMMETKKDILDGRHANTTIPKILGALNRYVVLGKGEELYLEAAKNFWDIVVHNHSYITGGNSEWEHFGKPNVLDAERTNCNCETCNSYNMLKLSKLLFEVTGDRKYADFYENTQINAILTSQNPETGMTTYFQPMATGYFKVYSTPFDKFWCCTGTGMESFTKLNDGIYFYEEEKIYVNRYISSEVVWDEKGVSISQEGDIPKDDTVKLSIKLPHKESAEFTLALRVPLWIEKEPVLKVNGKEVAYETHGGYIYLSRSFNHLDEINLVLEARLWYEALADNPNSIAFAYGPVVLCAAIGNEEKNIVQTGVMVDIPTKEMVVKDFIKIKEGTVTDWLQNIEDNLVKRDGNLVFELRDTDENLVFTPYYQMHKERYGIYWNFVLEDSKELQTHILNEKDRRRFDDSIIDMIPVGNDQYELVHHIKGEQTDVGGIEGHRCRVIREHGWFSYEFTLEEAKEYYIGTTYYKPDIGKVFNIYLDDELMISDTLSDHSGKRFFPAEYLVPKALIEDKKKIKIRFEHGDPIAVNSIWDLLYIRREYDPNGKLKAVLCNGIELQKEGNLYQLPPLEEGEDIILKFIPYNLNALVYLNGILIDDSLPRKIKKEEIKDLLITVVAENRETKEEYRIF